MRQGDTVDLLGHRSLTDLVIAFDQIDVIAEHRNFRHADPTSVRRSFFVTDRTPFPGFGIVSYQFDLIFRVILPLTLNNHPKGVADFGDPFETEAGLDRGQFCRQRDFFLDRALGIHVIQRMRNQPVTAAFGGDPIAALAVKRDAFHVELLGRMAGTRDRKGRGDAGRCLRCVDCKDRRLVAVEAVVYGTELAGNLRIRNQTGQRAPADQAVGTSRGDRRIGRRRVLIFKDHDMRAHAAVLDQVGLVGCDQQVSLRDGDDALWRDAGWQQLLQNGRRGIGHLIDADDRPALRLHENRRRAPEAGVFHTLRLNALGVNVDGPQHAGWRGVAFGRIHRDQRRSAGDCDRGRLAAHVDIAQRFRLRRVRDVDQAEHTQRAVGIGQCQAVCRRGDDFGRGFASGILAGRHVRRRGKRCDAVEIHVGFRQRRESDCQGDQRNRT